MKTTSIFWVSPIWLVLGIVFIFSFLLVSHQAHASGGEVHLTVRIPSVLAVQYMPTADNGLKVGASQDIRRKRAILIERTETPAERKEDQNTEKQPSSGKRIYMTIYTL